ncbi:proteophosphoglycan ppg4 [Gracilaria domingensis]|nr:proteophosphoglycan ppg4 [Gracilaria domingensis]
MQSIASESLLGDGEVTTISRRGILRPPRAPQRNGPGLVLGGLVGPLVVEQTVGDAQLFQPLDAVLLRKQGARPREGDGKVVLQQHKRGLQLVDGEELGPAEDVAADVPHVEQQQREHGGYLILAFALGALDEVVGERDGKQQAADVGDEQARGGEQQSSGDLVLGAVRCVNGVPHGDDGPGKGGGQGDEENPPAVDEGPQQEGLGVGVTQRADGGGGLVERGVIGRGKDDRGGDQQQGRQHVCASSNAG